MTHLMSIVSADYFTVKLEPAAELLRRALDRARPAATCERSVNFSKARILADNKQCHAGTFREC